VEPLAVVILTLDEELNLPKALASVGGRVPVLVVDSGSTDRTQAIAAAAGAEVIEHPFVDYASQRNFALELAAERFEWVFFLDADEELSPALWAELDAAIADPGLDGAYVRLELWMLGRRLTHGEYSDAMVLRLMRPRLARFRRSSNERVDDRDMRVKILDTRLIHRDAKPIVEWFKKHLGYAQREAKHYLDAEGSTSLDGFNIRTRAGRRVGLWWAYNRIPLFVRPLLFHGRALVKGAWRDGIPGLLYAGMHALWYPMVIDLLIFEAKREARREAKREAEVGSRRAARPEADGEIA
jgi:glycosyltransferase involved in cell wall biosynthesis